MRFNRSQAWLGGGGLAAMLLVVAVALMNALGLLTRDTEIATTLVLAIIVVPLALSAAELTYRLARMQSSLDLLAVTDPLTAVLNRSAFCAQAETLLGHHHAAGNHMSLVLIDGCFHDDLVRDYGSDFADGALEHLANIVRGSVRETDLVGRVGDTSFAVLFENIDNNSGQRVADRINFNVQSSPYCVDRSIIELSVISTVTDTRLGHHLARLLRQAERNIVDAQPLDYEAVA